MGCNCRKDDAAIFAVACKVGSETALQGRALIGWGCLTDWGVKFFKVIRALDQLLLQEMFCFSWCGMVERETSKVEKCEHGAKPKKAVHTPSPFRGMQNLITDTNAFQQVPQ